MRSGCGKTSETQLLWVTRWNCATFREDDLSEFFEDRLDPAATWMAALAGRDPTDRGASLAHWTRILHDDRVTARTILEAGQVVGHVASFEQAGQREVTYWTRRDRWGRGIATKALASFQSSVERRRPVRARAAKDNVASLCVLEKCGFTITGSERGFANARGEAIDEVILALR